jgi:outer membrane protein assembly factor BamB
MKQPRISFLIVIALLPLMLVSCYGTGQPAAGWAGTAFDGGVIYGGSRDGRVVAVNASNQGVLWSFGITATTSGGLSCGETTAAISIYTTPIVDGDLVYIGTYSGQVLVLSTVARSQNLTFPQQRYGEWRWNCPIDNAKSNAIVADLLVNDGAVYVSSSNGRVYSLDQEFGDVNWESEILDETHRKLWTSPVIQGDTLYVGTLDGHLYALSKETGELLGWSFESEAGFASSAVIHEDTLFLGSFDRYLYAVATDSDALKWRFPQNEPAGNWFWASPVVNEGIVYAGCLDGKLHAIRAETGEELWEFEAAGPIVSSPVLVEDILVIADERGSVYVFDIGAEMGGQAVPLRTISIDASFRSSFCAHDGVIYVRSEGNQLYAVDIDSGRVVDGWPVSLATEQ